MGCKADFSHECDNALFCGRCGIMCGIKGAFITVLSSFCDCFTLLSGGGLNFQFIALTVFCLSEMAHCLPWRVFHLSWTALHLP